MQCIWSPPKKIHIQGFLQELDDFRAFIDENNELDQFILNDHGMKAIPNDLMIHTAAPMTTSIVD
jgi:hypothetical protein